MNLISIHTQNNTTDDSLLNDLHTLSQKMGWIWSAGQDQDGFWCELFTVQEYAIIRGETLFSVLRKMMEHIHEEYVPL